MVACTDHSIPDDTRSSDSVDRSRDARHSHLARQAEASAKWAQPLISF
jgi:hypothetical protein